MMTWLYCLTESRPNFEFIGVSDIISEHYTVKLPLELDEAFIAAKVLGIFTEAKFFLERRLVAGAITSTSASGSLNNPEGPPLKVFQKPGSSGYNIEFISPKDIKDIDLNNLIPFKALTRKLQSIARQFSLEVDEISLPESNPIISILKGGSGTKPQNESIDSLSFMLTSSNDGIGLKESNFIKFHDSKIQVLEKLGPNKNLNLGPEFLTHYDFFTSILTRYIKLLDYITHTDGATPKGYWSNIFYAKHIVDQILPIGYAALDRYADDLVGILNGKLAPGLFNPEAFSKIKIALGELTPKPRWSLESLEELYNYPFYISRFAANETNFCESCDSALDLHLIVSIPITYEEEFRIFKLKGGKLNLYDPDQNKALEVILNPNKRYVLESGQEILQLSEEEFDSKCYRITNKYFCDANIIFYSADAESLPDPCLAHMFNNRMLDSVKFCSSMARPIEFSIIETGLNHYEITSVNPIQITFSHSSGKSHLVEYLEGQYVITLDSNVTKASSRHFNIEYETMNLERIEGYVTSSKPTSKLYGNHFADAFLEKEIFNYLVEADNYQHIMDPPLSLKKKLTEPLYYVSIMAVIITLSILTCILKFSIKLMDPQEFLIMWYQNLPCFRLCKSHRKDDQEMQSSSYIHGNYADECNPNTQGCDSGISGYRPDVRTHSQAFHAELAAMDSESI